MKRIGYFLLGIVFAFALSFGINSASAAGFTEPLEIYYQNSNKDMNTFCIIDRDTGVNYVVVQYKADTLRNNINGSVAICPRYDSDGSLYIDYGN